MAKTIEERARKFATRNYLNSDGEIVSSIVDPEVYQNALIVAKTIKQETIEKAWMLFGTFVCKYWTKEDFRKAMEE